MHCAHLRMCVVVVLKHMQGFQMWRAPWRRSCVRLRAAGASDTSKEQNTPDTTGETLTDTQNNHSHQHCPHLLRLTLLSSYVSPISWESNPWPCFCKHYDLLLELQEGRIFIFGWTKALLKASMIVLLSVILGFVRTGFSWTLFRDKCICWDSQPTVCLSQSQHASVVSDESHGWNKSFISPVKPAAVCQSSMCSQGFDLICSVLL